MIQSFEACSACRPREARNPTNEGAVLPENTDALSFEEIYRTYADRILNLVFRMTGSEEVARDLTQDVFVKVYENLSTFERRSQVYTWLYRIAVNHVTNHMKKEQRRRWTRLLDENVTDILREGEPESTGASAQRSMEEAERAAVVWRAVQSLPPKYRVPVVLYHYEGMSYREIAEAVGISVSAVETRIHRGRKKLMSQLEPWLEHI